jgi:hypothetical protein
VLSDFGADVIKVEPLEGDAYRMLNRTPGLPVMERNFPWELDSRNKRGIALDLKSPEALAVLHKLVAQADVFVTNLPLPARRRLKIGYESLGPLNPRMIYASFTAYGETGPEADKTGFDSTAYWARSGLMDIMRADHTATPARSAAGAASNRKSSPSGPRTLSWSAAPGPARHTSLPRWASRRSPATASACGSIPPSIWSTNWSRRRQRDDPAGWPTNSCTSIW